MKGVELQIFLQHYSDFTDSCTAQEANVVFNRYKFAQLLNVFSSVVPPGKFATLKKQP